MMLKVIPVFLLSVLPWHAVGADVSACEWENPLVVQRNKEPGHVPVISYETEADASRGARTHAQYSISPKPATFVYRFIPFRLSVWQRLFKTGETLSRRARQEGGE